MIAVAVTKSSPRPAPTSNLHDCTIDAHKNCLMINLNNPTIGTHDPDINSCVDLTRAYCLSKIMYKLIPLVAGRLQRIGILCRDIPINRCKERRGTAEADVVWGKSSSRSESEL